MKNLLNTWQRPNLPQYTAIERILGIEIHDALSGAKAPRDALEAGARQIEHALRSWQSSSHTTKRPDQFI